MKSNDIIMTFSLLCKNKVVEKPLDHMKNHELDKNRKISTPNNMKEFYKTVKRSKDVTLIETNESRFTSTRCLANLEGNEINTIIDTGAAVCTITRKLSEKLGISPEMSSDIVVTTADGGKHRSLGRIRKLHFLLEGVKTYATVEVIESKHDEILILGTDWIKRNNAKIDFEDEIMEIKTENGYKNIPIEFMVFDEDTEEEYEDEELREERFRLKNEVINALEIEQKDIIEEFEDRGGRLIETVKKGTNKEGKYTIGNMTKAQEQELENLLKRYEDIFAKDEYDLGRTDIVKHEIDTGDCKPIKQAAYKVNPHKKKIIENEVKKMFKKGVIRKSNSPWSSPITLVPKPNGKWRFCTDYRKLNEITRK